MKYLHSHNDYHNRSQFFKALKADCNIFEVDVMLIDGELMMTHSWRPFRWLCFGKLKDYMFRFYTLNKKNKYLYIELKTSDYRAIHKLHILISQYPDMKILIKGIDRWFSPDRAKNAELIKNRCDNVEFFDDFIKGKDYERVDLYKSSLWKIWNRF